MLNETPAVLGCRTEARFGCARSAFSTPAFTLIEAMVAGTIIALAAAGIASTLTFTTAESSRARTRAQAAAEAHEVLDRLSLSVVLAVRAGATNTQLCKILTATGGPMDASRGTLSATCSEAYPFSVTNISIPQAIGVKRSVTIDQIDLDGTAAISVAITVNGPALVEPIVINSIVKG